MSSSGNGNGSNPDKKLEDFLENLQGLKATIESDTLTNVKHKYEGKIEELEEELSKLKFYYKYDTEKLEKIIDDNINMYKKHLNKNRETNKELCDKNSGLDSENQRLKAENEELKKKLAKMLEAEAKRLEQEKEKECPICMGPRQDEVKTKCGHCFCRLCIIDSMKWNPDCPLCREEIKESFDLPKVGGGVLQNTPPSSSCSGGRVQQQLGHVSTRGGGHPDDDSDDYSDDYSDDGSDDDWARTMTRNIMDNGGDFGDNY